MKRALILTIPVCVTMFFGYLGLHSLATGEISISQGARNPGPIRKVARSEDPALYWRATGASLAASAFGLGLCALIYRKIGK
jgi:hypothetical protein